MKKESLILIFIILASFLIVYLFNNITGKAVAETHTIGPDAEEQACMMQCMKCTSPGVGCTGNQEQCMTQCNAEKPEQSSEEKCVEECVSQGCGQYDFSCQSQKQAECDKQCGMIKAPEAKSEEEQCIRDCVNTHSPGTICKPSQEGEQGNDVCKMCAQQCVHLYSGPCLGEEKLEEKKKTCMTCEHCYAKTIMGPSGEGWDCIVDVECADASSEFGDEPGTGPGIAKQFGEIAGNIMDGIVGFFKGLFGGNDNPQENIVSGSSTSE